MKPILYEKNGITVIGTLEDVLSAKVSENLNGAFTATIVYPSVGLLYSQITYDSVIGIKPNQKSEIQLFRVAGIRQGIDETVQYSCEHISYELNKNPIMVISTKQDNGTLTGNPQMLLNYILNGTVVHNSFIGESDITQQKRVELDFMSAREAILKVQNYFGGELEWDNYRVILHSRRGVYDPKAVISYGNNLLDYSDQIDISNVYTAIAPYMQVTDEDGEKETVTIPQQYLPYWNVENYWYVRAKPVDLTNEFTEEDLASGDLSALLVSKAYEYMDSNDYDTELTHNVTISYVDLRKAKEFAAIETINDLGLADYVVLRDERKGINFKGKIVSYRYDAISEMYDSIEVGNPSQKLLDSLASIVDFGENSETIGEKVEDIEKVIDEYFSVITVEDKKITFKSGNIKDEKGVYNTYVYKLERDSDIQSSGKGRIISVIDPQNRKTKIKRK